MNSKTKKEIVRFLVGGALTLLLYKGEKLIYKKTDEYFGPDEADE